MVKKFYHKVDSIIGPIIVLKASNVGFLELARIHKHDGRKASARVLRVINDQVFLQVFCDSRAISTDDQVEFLGHGARLNFDEELILGRIFDSSGGPIDNRPSLDQIEKVDVAGSCVNPLNVLVPSNQIPSGIPLIDLCSPFMEGQSISIVSEAQDSSEVLMARLLSVSDADVYVVGMMGVKRDDLLSMHNQLGSKRHKTVMFIHEAIDPVAECALIPELVFAAAEQFAALGKRVLVLFSDFAAYGDAIKEVAAAMDAIPCHRGYPSDFYAQTVARFGRSAHFDGGGSITTILRATVPDNDIAHPIREITASIAEEQLLIKEGRVVLGGTLFAKRLLKATREDHAILMSTMMELYCEATQTRQDRAMGVSMSRYDEKLLDFAQKFEQEMMELKINRPLSEQLDLGWKILASHFIEHEVSLPNKIVAQYWPKSGARA